MFDHFLMSVVVVPPVLVVLVRLLADRLSPQVAAPVMAWSAAGAAVASLVNLVVFALKAVAEIPAVGSLFGWSSRIVVDDTARFPWVSWLSVVLLAAASASMTVTWRRQRRLLALAGAGSGLGAVVMVPDTAAHAFAVPGKPGHVVVTTGMREALSDEQFAALLAHEQAHLDARHHRLILVSELAAASHPALWWVTRHVDYLVERAADERAATTVGSRRTVAQAIGAAALAATARPSLNAGLHAASPGGVVPRRVASLLKPRGWAAAPILAVAPLGLAIFSLAWTVEAAWDLGELIVAALP
ncbi:membrane protein [Actinoplanes italicus]|uniref:Peptidase M48-like protein n=1 Tax=Actinoplanes italicus TaxID=113567 RepID=A0A2T0K8Q4_9ACTN|nr:M56 family metallopeptidase [Actinoplanes italicus]PRX19273.1 peptidase M48-like protein [Actinoplanes italicus]GIE30712.1 membrane protein [Actinoplanes italicus]